MRVWGSDGKESESAEMTRKRMMLNAADSYDEWWWRGWWDNEDAVDHESEIASVQPNTYASKRRKTHNMFIQRNEKKAFGSRK